MATLKCKMCGGSIEVSGDKTFGSCDYCGSTTTLPKCSDEQRAALFNRGNTLRIKGEFDKALDIFEKIIQQDNSDAEAHWCAVLSRFGIEYVEDPKTFQRIPTCHRASYDLILNDIDYLAAIENSDSYTACIYKAQAREIADIQKAILTISKKEEPFDVFICYKESTEGGSRTKDSTIAQDIYFHLKNEGINVFFSRITLEDKLGAEYEPYIFAALNSAKVMLVIGTSPDYFNAVWVKNEWSRFLSILKKDRTRLLIPCYKDMDPYDLPEELSGLQSQDMNKIGFIQDITRGIKKVLGKNNEEKVSKNENTGNVSSLSLERLIKNSETYLKLDNYTDAEEVFTRITKEYPEDYRGWIGLIICATSNFTEIKYTDNESYEKWLVSISKWLKYAKKLSTPAQYSDIESKLVEFCKKISERDTRNENTKVKNIIKEEDLNLKNLHMMCEEIEGKKTARYTHFTKQLANHEATITKLKSNLYIFERELKKCSTKKRIGICLLLLAFFLIIINMMFNINASAFGVFVIIALLIIGTHNLSSKTSGKRKSGWIASINETRLKLDYANAEKNTEINAYNSDMMNYDSEIEVINNKMSEAHNKITKCNKYIENDNELISELHYARRCVMFGVTRSSNSELVTLREEIFS